MITEKDVKVFRETVRRFVAMHKAHSLSQSQRQEIYNKHNLGRAERKD